MPKYRVLALSPLVALPLLAISPASAGRAAWATFVIASLWATEALPIAVTSLLPIVLFPLLGVVPADRVSRNYFADKIVLFFGGLIVASALEAVCLHRRMALRVLLLFGTRPPWLLAGFMCATAFLSMWMSNTATAAMMMPIAESVISQLEAAPRAAAGAAARSAASADAARMPNAEGEDERAARCLGKALVLGVAYAANIGGMATLTGTGPNLVLAGQLTTLYEGADGLSFASWLGFALPLSMLVLAMAWALLWLFFLSRHATTYDASGTARALQREYLLLGGRVCSDCLALIDGLGDLALLALMVLVTSPAARIGPRLVSGPISFRETLVLFDFGCLALLWITRHPKIIPGWGELFGWQEFVTDGTTSAAMALLLFVLPAEPPAICAIYTRGALRRWARMPEQPVLSEISLSIASPSRVQVEESVAEATAAAPAAAPASAASCASSVTDESTSARSKSVAAASPPPSPPPLPATSPLPPSLSSPPPPSPPPSAQAPARIAPSSSSSALLEWSDVQRTLPWGVILLLGGGFALADAVVASGLSRLIGAELSILGSLPTNLVALVLMLIVSACTSVASNVATANIFIPVVAGLADSMGVHPLVFMLCTTLT